MKGISRRARACAAVAVTGVTVLATAGAAHAQRPPTVGDGVPTGQGSVQMFNYGGYLNNGGNAGTNPPPEIANVSENCRQGGTSATSTECRLERLEALFKFLQRKGVTSIELFGHAGFPASTDIAGLQAYRALMDKYGLHAAGWHGSMNEAQWDTRVNAAKILGADYIGSGGVADPGINSYQAVLDSAAALNRLGKRAVEAGVGRAYIHNHEQEFDRKYVHNGVLTTAFDILMMETDPRYVAAELDVFWAQDAHDDLSGEASAGLINKWPTRIRMLHMKDGLNAEQRGANSSRAGNPEPFGTGTIDFRPVLTAARNRVQYYHQEEDGGTLTGADVSLTNLKGTGPNVVGTVLGYPTSFPSVPAGTAAADNVVPVTLQNTGDAPLTITNVQIQADPLDVGAAGDFAIVSQNCSGAGSSPLAPGRLDDPATPEVNEAAPRGTCTVNVGFKPTRTNHRSVARLQITSGSDNATEQVLLTGLSTGEALSTVGGDVPSLLSLTVGSAATFGTFVPAQSATYETASAATVTSTAGDAVLSVTDTSETAPGHLVNPAGFSLPSALQVRAANAANPNPAYAPLSETAGTPVNLLTYNGPTAGADPVTLGFRQAIGATDTLRAGTYSKTLTFTLSTTQP
ncbi:MAG TPA: TIM barrel protein [Solirubrobacter sp.]|nr:TIM barrel protein [Solirubrobacter sp.]